MADVRRFPGSRRSPHFARAALEETSPAHDPYEATGQLALSFG